MLKTVHFRQVGWVNQPENLVQLLSSTLLARPNVEDTVHNIGLELCEVRHRHVSPGEVRLHLVTYVEGATKGVRPDTNGQPAADVLEATPPPASEFVEREIALVARQHTLGYVAGGHVFGSTVERSLRSLLRLNHPGAVANRLLLPARADAAMIQELMEGGIDQLDLKLALPAPDADQIGVGRPVGLGEELGRRILGGLSARLFADHEDHEIDALANASANIGIRLGRKPSLEEIEALTEVASDAVESGDEFTIRNLDGVVFSRDKLSLKTTYTQPGPSATLSVAQAWNEITAFLDTVG